MFYFSLQKRMWRKNRQATGTAHCLGVDINRNFNPHFGGAGTSKNPCTENYHGLSPLSERESSAVAQFIDKLENTKIYITFHAFGQLLMYPYVSTNSISRSIHYFLSFNLSTLSISFLNLGLYEETCTQSPWFGKSQFLACFSSTNWRISPGRIVLVEKVLRLSIVVMERLIA